MTENSGRTDGRLLALGALLAGLGVGASAFGAHGLRATLSAERLEVFRTAATYQMFHGVAIVAVAAAMSHFNRSRLRVACWFFVAGTLMFSGSLYALALGSPDGLGMITPIGGVAFLAGWLMVASGSFR